jgi:LAO/AO transport system kinase
MDPAEEYLIDMSMDEALLSGDRLALSRFLSQVENGDPQARPVLDRLYKHTGSAHIIGVTGAPGTGKSSLVNRLTKVLRSSSTKKAAILAIDPSSPFSGGAILGDRVRMRDLAGDSGVFIRSMATRGALGGLALATARMVTVFDAVGFDLILVETVGAGQSEVDIARLAHTTLVVEAPGYGDDIQAIKAGIMEIADILIINKADLPGVENTERALRSNLEMGYASAINSEPGHQANETAKGKVPGQAAWIPPILRTIATQEDGVAGVWEKIEEHIRFLKQSGKLEKLERERVRAELRALVQARLLNQWRDTVGTFRIESALQQVVERQWSPDQAVDWLVNNQ